MKEITTDALIKMIEQGNAANIIDVRETDEVAEGKIPGAMNIPLGLVEFRMNELNKSKEYIIVCHSGGRSGRAVQFLESHGYSVTNMVGGMLAWTGAIE